MQVRATPANRGSLTTALPQPNRWRLPRASLVPLPYSPPNSETLEVYYRYLPLYQPQATPTQLRGQGRRPPRRPRPSAEPLPNGPADSSRFLSPQFVFLKRVHHDPRQPPSRCLVPQPEVQRRVSPEDTIRGGRSRHFTRVPDRLQRRQRPGAERPQAVAVSPQEEALARTAGSTHASHAPLARLPPSAVGRAAASVRRFQCTRLLIRKDGTTRPRTSQPWSGARVPCSTGQGILE